MFEEFAESPSHFFFEGSAIGDEMAMNCILHRGLNGAAAIHCSHRPVQIICMGEKPLKQNLGDHNNASNEKPLPSKELTYPLPAGTFEDDFPFPQVGYVRSLEGIHMCIYQITPCTDWIISIVEYKYKYHTY